MSSNRIEPTRAALGGRRNGLLKRILPRSLFGRSVLILITPLILVQAVATWVFYDRLWDTVVRRLAGAAAGDIALTIDARSFADGRQAQLFELAHGSTEFSFQMLPGAQLPDQAPAPSGSLTEHHLTNALAERVGRPFQIDEKSQADQHVIDIAIQLPDGVLDVAVPRSRVLIGAPYIFILWMVGTALITFALATRFLRNQVRSLRRLANAAEAFGKGRDVPNFKPEGATEVRQAAAAFLIMRERLQRQISQRTEMLAGVSHDLRTPLTRMKLELELLGDAEEVQGLRGDVAEMQQMIEGYLAFARGEGNEQPTVVDLMEFLQEAVATSRRGGTEISLIGPKELHVPIRRDALRRCLMNLIDNANRYGGHVWLTVVPTQSGVEMMIDDDGPGIPEALREAVFRPFFRLESSRNQATGGIGLGLTIARDIMLSHGGDLKLETSPQGGLRARLILPR
ncbi:MAG: ATPase [Rhodospirillales bacterium]|jgi:two-component system osmolarity sensor histidine kinase EnvZ|nr:ATPase [Rhodospirillales bacterium]